MNSISSQQTAVLKGSQINKTMFGERRRKKEEEKRLPFLFGICSLLGRAFITSKPPPQPTAHSQRGAPHKGESLSRLATQSCKFCQIQGGLKRRDQTRTILGTLGSHRQGGSYQTSWCLRCFCGKLNFPPHLQAALQPEWFCWASTLLASFFLQGCRFWAGSACPFFPLKVCQ